MKIGYARVSTPSQDTSLQIDALKVSGCETIYEEKALGSKKDRPKEMVNLTSQGIGFQRKKK